MSTNVTLPPFQFAGANAVLTGAASGMGEMMAHQLAERGANLVLVDRDEPRLIAVADLVRDAHPSLVIRTEVTDLADPAAVAALVERVSSLLPRLDLLINNAGVALGGAFADVSAEEFDWVLAVNFAAPVALCRGLLPALRAAPGSHVVNVSSVFGLVGPAGQSAYAASKFALRGFSEVLRQELAPLGVGVTTVHPGGIRTRISETARMAATYTAEQEAAGKAAFARLLTYPADQAADRILSGVHRRQGRVLVAPSAYVLDLLARVFPTRYPAILRRLGAIASRSGLLR